MTSSVTREVRPTEEPPAADARVPPRRFLVGRSAGSSPMTTGSSPDGPRFLLAPALFLCVRRPFAAAGESSSESLRTMACVCVAPAELEEVRLCEADDDARTSTLVALSLPLDNVTAGVDGGRAYNSVQFRAVRSC